MTSFDFEWTKSDKPIGKVFARKRNVIAKVKPVKLSVNTKPTKPVEQKSISSVQLPISPSKSKPNVEQPKKTVVFARREPQSFPANVEPSPFIKRKQRKDKNAAKLQQTEASEHNLQSGESSQSQARNKQSSNQTYSLFSVHHKNIYVDTEMAGKSVVETVFSAKKEFMNLDIHKHIVSNLVKNGFTKLTNVQERAVPVLCAGKNALIRSQTGSGKTLAYAVPIINALQGITPRIVRNSGVQAIIIVPTRELAQQVHELFTKISTFQWIVVGHLCGGENRNTEKNRLRKGTHILIATPGRLLDHILHTAAFRVENVRCLVLDEADRLLDMGFKQDIEKIVDEIDKAKSDNAAYNPLAILRREQQQKEKVLTEVESDLPPLKNIASKTRQTILLSATLTKSLGELAEFLMKEHVYIDTLDDSKVTINPDHMVIPNTVQQEFIMTYAKHRLFTLSAVLIAKAKSKIFVFMATSQMVEYHYELFSRYLVHMPKNRGKLSSGNVLLLDEEFDDSDDEDEVVLDTEFYKLHGNMDQAERKNVFTKFRAAKKGVLICTDVAARGVDVPEADCIIQYTGPQSDEDYLHRVGRTGRAGKSGSALIFLTHEEQEYIAELQRHKVFLKKREPEEYLKHLCNIMEEADYEKAATSLQHRYESAINKDRDLHRKACFAFSSWSRFYNYYPGKMRSIFNFKTANLGHYVTSFALKETPSNVTKIIRDQVVHTIPRRLNRKLATHDDNETRRAPQQKQQKRKIKSVSLSVSEFSSGLEPAKKKRNRK